MSFSFYNQSLSQRGRTQSQKNKDQKKSTNNWKEIKSE